MKPENFNVNDRATHECSNKINIRMVFVPAYFYPLSKSECMCNIAVPNRLDEALKCWSLLYDKWWQLYMLSHVDRCTFKYTTKCICWLRSKWFASNYIAHFRHSSIILHSIFQWADLASFDCTKVRFNQITISLDVCCLSQVFVHISKVSKLINWIFFLDIFSIV